MNAPELLTPAEAARHLTVAEHSLAIWRSNKRYRIPFIRVGRAIRYRRADLDAWLASRTVDSDAVAA